LLCQGEAEVTARIEDATHAAVLRVEDLAVEAGSLEDLALLGSELPDLDDLLAAAVRGE
jgi:hypothetical protein